MPQLQPFDVNAWIHGKDGNGRLEFDFTGKRWGGTVSIKIKKGKPAKAAKVIKPAIGVLTSEFDSGGRSLEDHQAAVDWMAERYDSRKQLFTDEPITDEKEIKKCDAPRNDAPWGKNRGGANTDSEGLKLLMEAMKYQHDQNHSDDE